MSRKELLDLTVFDDMRKSEMVYRRPQLVRKSDPSVYDKLLEPSAMTEFSKANYWTTAPQYDCRKFSDVELDNPKCSNYLMASGLVVVWVLSQASLIPAYEILRGDTLRSCTQLALVRFTVSVGQLLLQQESLQLSARRLYRSFIAFIMLSIATFCTIILVHNLSLTMVALLLNCDCMASVIVGRQKAAFAAILVLPVLYFLNFWMVLLGVLTVVLVTALHYQTLDPGEQTQANFMVMVMFLLVSCFSGPPLLYLDQWTFLSFSLLATQRFIVLHFVQLIVRNYVRSATAHYLLKTSTVVLAAYEHIFHSMAFFLLILLAVLGQIICENAYREKQQRMTLMLNDNL